MNPDVPELTAVVVAALCVWRVTHLIVAEDGPWRAIARLQRVVARVAPAGLLDCFYCTSLWVSAAFAIGLAAGWCARLALWLAASAGAIALERLSARPAVTGVAVPYFEPELDHVEMLRTQARTDPD